MIRKDMWTEKEINYIIKNAGIKSYAEIGNEIGRTRNAVMIKLNRMGYKLDKINIFNENYFENIDTEEKAYWLGFIYADGNVYINKKNGKNLNYAMCIEIKGSDFNHLKKFNKSISGNLKIKLRNREIAGYEKKYSMASIRIYSKKFINDLIVHGVIENKSMLIEIPFINSKLLWHFIRGYFDGDGSISIEKRSKQLRCNFTSGSINFLNQLKKIFIENNIHCYVGKTNKYGKSYTLGITGRGSTINFLNNIYNESSIYLERKYNFYLSNINLLNYIREGWNKNRDASICGNTY